MPEQIIPLWLNGWIVAALAPIALIFPVLSALLERSGPIRLRHWAEEAGGSLRQLYDRPARFEAFRLVLNLVARLAPVLLLVCLWALLRGLGVPGGWWIAPAIVAAMLVLVEWANRTLVGIYSAEALSALTVVLRLSYKVVLPFTWLLERLVPVADDSDEEEDESEASDEEIDAYIDVGLREGILEPEAEELVRSIVEFSDTQVRSVMTPRVEINSASADATLEELAQVFFASKNARLPIYSGSIDQIVGILHIRDLFEAVHNGRPATAGELSNPPHYVPETKTLLELLTELQALRQQMAIVVDEYGGVAGLVTVEDLVEEIVGDIADEHEAADIPGVRLDDHRWQVLGRTDLETLGELFDLDLDDLPYETVSGLVCGELGYVPKAGEVVESHGLLFEIEEADGRRVTSVAVGRVSMPERVEAGSQSEVTE